MNNKWWENYLVRYALGFVFALAFSYFILNKFVVYAESKGITIIKKALEGTSDNISLMLLIPLAASICYICAAPIIVLHTDRYRRGLVDRLSRNFWCSWVVFSLPLYIFRNKLLIIENYFYCILTINIVILYVVWYFVKFRKVQDPFNGWIDFFIKTLFVFLIISIIYNSIISFVIYNEIIDLAHMKVQATWIYLSLPAAWIFIGQYSVLHRILKDEPDFYSFYKNLSKKRSNPKFSDARETYSHLREHSNAFFIVAVEISVFSFILFLINHFEDKSLPPESYVHIFHIIIFVLLAWMMSAVFMWSTANRLERKFSDDFSDETNTAI